MERGWAAERGRDWEKGKGKSKRGGKSKGKKGGKQLNDRTPDGRQICWKWNNPRERCRFNSGRLHVCQIASGPIRCMPAMAVARRKTPRGAPQRAAESPPDRTKWWALPQAHHKEVAQRGAHEEGMS